jgi:arylsulfatase A-like enzyme
VLDTLRWDRVGTYAGSNLTPNLDRLAQSSIIYEQAMSTAPWTLPTHASLFTGLFPQEHGVSWGHYRLEDDPPVLAELLKDRGYHTFAVSNNWLLSGENGFARGFDLFLETATDPLVSGWRLALRCAGPRRFSRWLGMPEEMGTDAGSAWTNWMVERHLKAAEVRDRPFLMFVNYFEPHDPYLPPPPFLLTHLTPEQRATYRRFRQNEQDLCAHACGLTDTFTKEQVNLMEALYDAEVAYQDAMVGKLLETLDDADLLDRSWLVITSDHGELFGEAGLVFHTASAHYQLLHVPLIVRPPGGVAATRVAAPVQPVDVFATLVEAAGAAVPAQVRRAFRLPLSGDEPAERSLCVSQTFGASVAGLSVAQYRNMQFDLTKWMRWVTSLCADGYLLELDETGPRGLYNVGSDPAMEHNVSDEHPEVVKSLMLEHRRWATRTDEGGAL